MGERTLRTNLIVSLVAAASLSLACAESKERTSTDKWKSLDPTSLSSAVRLPAGVAPAEEVMNLALCGGVMPSDEGDTGAGTQALMSDARISFSCDEATLVATPPQRGIARVGQHFDVGGRHFAAPLLTLSYETSDGKAGAAEIPFLCDAPVVRVKGMTSGATLKLSATLVDAAGVTVYEGASQKATVGQDAATVVMTHAADGALKVEVTFR